MSLIKIFEDLPKNIDISKYLQNDGHKIIGWFTYLNLKNVK